MPVRTVLVVEDSPLTRRMIRRMLEQHGSLDVVEAGDGREAMEILNSQAVDIVLSDLHMEPMDGHGLMAEMRLHPALAHLPFIMMTAQHCPDSIRRTIGDHSSHYLPKPFTREQLYAALQRSSARQAA
ncbi:response regulator [Magnetospirillum gryphiswaldense]|uniref:Chemotaxis protein CheY n=1 Tax=Magnetospirillum gryphiswaldense TaxID=55518 RepID=A4U0R8_9PROT|nr:response regulator [Magnetospirillum gryphiswaldense]AVM74249.1 Chemotaxis protein CheY [Magnetospirillum gryphiswaldense MSR-1]AVM78152.1 Chemotaxis protein CheY [Magnetospirillum gryphiswaldense]CAM76475.1 chemotaxis protein CheY [Magnetospirillum gryphiswaldense MSR-1]